jgi:hypothetical protein
MSDSEFDRLMESQKREGVPTDTPSSSAELDTRRSKSALGPSVLGGSDQVVIGYDDANQSPIFGHEPAVATPHASDAAGAGGGSDIIYGDADEGVIAGGNRVQPAAPVAQAPAQEDIVFLDNDEGAVRVDLSAHAGESNFRLDATEETDQATLANQQPQTDA